MDNWLPTLITPTPTEGYDLAVKLARMAIKKTQPDAAVRDRLRPGYAAVAEAPLWPRILPPSPPPTSIGATRHERRDRHRAGVRA